MFEIENKRMTQINESIVLGEVVVDVTKFFPFCLLCSGGVANGCNNSCNNSCTGGYSAACSDTCDVSCTDNCSAGCYGSN